MNRSAKIEKIKIRLRDMLKFLLVMLAFALMIISSYFFGENIIKSFLKSETDKTLLLAETQIISEMKEIETMLGVVAEGMREMLLHGAALEDAEAYMKNMDAYGRGQNISAGLKDFSAMFDIFGGAVYGPAYGDSSTEFRDGDDPLWLIAAIEANGGIAATDVETDRTTGKVSFSYARCLFDDNGERIATVSANVSLDRIFGYSSGIHSETDNYWGLVDSGLNVISHPDMSFLGKQLRDVDSGISLLAPELEQGDAISERSIENYMGERSTATTKPLGNGWHLIVVSPIESHYAELKLLLMELAGIGSALALWLCLLLAWNLRARNRMGEEKATLDNLSAVLNGMDTMVYVSDSDTNEILFANDAIKEYFRIDSDVIGQKCYKIFKGRATKCDDCPSSNIDEKSDQSVVWEEINPETEQVRRNVDRYINWPGGKRVHLQCSSDMTDIRHMQNELEVQNRRLSLLIDGLGAAVWDYRIDPGKKSIDADNEIWWSEDFRKLLGFEDENDFPDVVGSWFNCIHPEDQEEQNTIFAEFLYDKTGQTPYNPTYRIRMKDERYIWVSTFGSAFRDEEGNPLRVVGATANVTEQKEAQAVEQALHESQAMSKAKSAFLANMSHEIRTPMNVIFGIVEIMYQSKNLSRDLEEGIDKIYSSCELLLTLLSDILDLSKAEAGKMEIKPGNYNVASMIDDVICMNITRLDSKSVAFELKINENIPAEIIGDSVRIKQILNNLISNAFKYTEAGKVTLSIDIDPGEMGDGPVLILSVQDTGCGMTREQLEKIFDEYFRLDKHVSRVLDGAGLGLAITRNLTSLMGGTITAESKVGEGSLFTVRLPQKSAGLSDILGAETARNLRTLRIGYARQKKRDKIVREQMPYGKVLIVDDVGTNRYVAVELMKLYRLKIDTAVSGYEAVDAIKGGQAYDIVFMDHMMPGMDGIEATAILRDFGYTAPIVALTANAVDGSAEMFLQNGFDEVLFKPIDIRQLDLILHKLVRDKQPEHTLKDTDTQPQTQQGVIVMPQRQSFIAGRKIDGLDIPKGLQRYGGNERAYIKILRTYTSSVREMLEKINTVSSETLADYRIIVHGIKGASFDIFAEQIAGKALALENAARQNDLEYVNENHQTFIDLAMGLVDGINAELDAIERENPKPKKARPDDEMLLKLLGACKSYDMDGADAIMEEIESWQYEFDGGLVEWLKDNIDRADFSDVAEKLSYLSDGGDK
ncbi:MAG: ATP-binding protein [Oscillospiraceae bacterium]|nr:ATP-binding protein [Oscillospiraceae bacterium]